MEDRTTACLIALRRLVSAADLNTRALARLTGLGATQLLVLRIVEEAGEVTPKTVSVRAGIAPASATTLIEKLVQQGLIERRRGVSDRRSYWLTLTDAGRRVLETAPDPLQARLAEGLRGLERWEQAMILAALERLAGLVADPQAARPAPLRPPLPEPDRETGGHPG